MTVYVLTTVCPHAGCGKPIVVTVETKSDVTIAVARDHDHPRVPEDAR